jgi:hypothetical protein
MENPSDGLSYSWIRAMQEAEFSFVDFEPDE